MQIFILIFLALVLPVLYFMRVVMYLSWKRLDVGLGWHRLVNITVN